MGFIGVGVYINTMTTTFGNININLSFHGFPILFKNIYLYNLLLGQEAEYFSGREGPMVKD